MKQVITESTFIQAFSNYNREDNFSREGLITLYNYLEEIYQNYELDVIDLCCTYAEYSGLEEFQQYYGEDYETLDDIKDKTTVIEIKGTEGFIIEVF